VTVIGACGWYPVVDPDHWRGYMQDARFMTSNEVNERHEQHAEYLDSQLKISTNPCIVVTHMAPCEETLDPRYVGSLGNQYFWSPLLREVLAAHQDKIVRWHHGHTHKAMHAVVDGVEIITNPRGYPRENPNWTPLICQI
jgi:Icc-related predicted phosphoesterase